MRRFISCSRLGGLRYRLGCILDWIEVCRALQKGFGSTKEFDAYKQAWLIDFRRIEIDTPLEH